MSMEEAHSAETGKKGNGKRVFIPPAVTPLWPVMQGILRADLQGMKSWILETRPTTAEMFMLVAASLAWRSGPATGRIPRKCLQNF